MNEQKRWIGTCHRCKGPIYNDEEWALAEACDVGFLGMMCEKCIDEEDNGKKQLAPAG